VNTGSFADDILNAQGGLLAVSGGAPLQHQGNYALYAVGDQMLWRPDSNSDRGLSVFARVAATPSDRNLINAYVEGGVTFKGPIASRPDDTVGLAIAYAGISPALSTYDREVIAATGKPMPVRDFEATIELTYRWNLAKDWYVQPDLQYIIHPGGNIPNPARPTGTSAIPNALVVGMRTVLRF
jgi:porin